MGLRPKKPGQRGAMRRAIPMTLTMRFVPDETTTKLHERLEALIQDPLVLARILRAASIDILLAAYRERFVDAMPRMTNLRRINNPGGPDNEVPESVTMDLIRASALVSAQRQAGNERGLAAAMEQLADARQRMTEALKNKNDPPHGRLGEGSKFRPLLHDIMQYMSDVSGTKLHIGGALDSIVFGIAPRKKLDAIKTPSATPHITGHQTSSDLTTMWRQIEFGSGVDGVDPYGNPGSPYQLDDGGWFYGRNKKDSIKLLGNSPAHVLWNASGVAYKDDRDELEAKIAAMLMAHLIG